MTKIFLPEILSLSLLVSLSLLLSSCTTPSKPFGLSEIEFAPDTILIKEEIRKIKTLDHHPFDSATYIGSNNIAIRYRLFTPYILTTEKLPLIVVFHGSGQIGNDNVSQLVLLPKLFASRDIQREYPAYILAPQFSTRSSDYTMDSSRNVLTAISRDCLDAAIELIDSIAQHQSIDPERIYAIGFSMGGSTAINALSLRPDLFAAGISIAGIPQFDKINELTNLPIWLIHGTDDTENPIQSDDQFYRELSPYGKIRFWRVAGRSHNDIFALELLGEALPEWLFNQKKIN